MSNPAEKLIQRQLERIQKSKHGRQVVGALVVLAVLALAGHFVYKMLPRQYTLTITGGEIVGNRHFLAKVLQEEAAAAGITLRIVPTHGSVAALRMLDEGKLDVALIQGGLDNEYPNVQHVATLPPEMIHVLVRPDIHSIADIRGKEVNLGGRGGGTRIVAQKVLSFSGLENGIDYVEVNHGDEDLLSMRADKLPPVIVVVSFVPSFVADSLVKERGYRLLELPFPQALAMRENWAADGRILSYMYNIQPPVPAADVETVGLNLLLLMNRKVDPDAVFRLMEVLYGPKVENRVRLGLNERDVAKPSGFPMSKATVAFLDRKKPLLSPALFGVLKNAAGLGMTVLSALLVMMRWFRGQSESEDKVFKAMLKDVAGIEGEIRALDGDPAATIAAVAGIENRLSELKEKVLRQFPSSVVKDQMILDRLLAAIADTRAYQRSVQGRIEARAIGPA